MFKSIYIKNPYIALPHYSYSFLWLWCNLCPYKLIQLGKFCALSVRPVNPLIIYASSITFLKQLIISWYLNPSTTDLLPRLSFFYYQRCSWFWSMKFIYIMKPNPDTWKSTSSFFIIVLEMQIKNFLFFILFSLLSLVPLLIHVNPLTCLSFFALP